jgi:hypothetical protein
VKPAGTSECKGLAHAADGVIISRKSGTKKFIAVFNTLFMTTAIIAQMF